MGKRVFFAGNLILLFAAVLLLLSVKGAGDRMFPQISAKEISKINKNFMVTDKDILSVLRYNGNDLPRDEEQGIFYLPLSMADSDWKEGKITSGTDGIEIAFLTDVESESKEELIRQGTRIPFYALSGNVYREYYLVITGLSLVEITTQEAPEEEDGEGLYHIRVLNADSKTDWVTESDAFMHVRGNTSRTYPKKGYKLSMVKQTASGEYVGNKQALLGMRKDDDWILYAMYNDGTKVRDKLCIDIWNAYGAENNDFDGTLGTDLTYVEVIWDGDYYGIYGLMEPVDASQVNLKNQEDGLHLTEYLYKRKHPSELDLEKLGEDSGEMLRDGFEIKGGKVSSSVDDWAPLKELLTWQEQKSDEKFAAEAENMVDVDNTVDFWIFANLITGYDQLAKNVYYVAKAENRQYRFYFAPWDMDLTFGYTSDPDCQWGTKYEDFLTGNYIWWEPGNRMMETNAAGARTLAEERYQYLRQEVLTDEWFENELQSLQEIVVNSGAFARDQERWPDGNHEGDYEELARYTRERLGWLDIFMSDIETGLKDWE